MQFPKIHEKGKNNFQAFPDFLLAASNSFNPRGSVFQKGGMNAGVA